jgi:hypothetical protein
MSGVGNPIIYADYNSIQSLVNTILGTTSTGYGQILQSSQISSAGNNLKAQTGDISVPQWNALQNDITRIFYHQLNTAPTPALTTALTTTTIKESDRAAYNAMTLRLTDALPSTYLGVSYPGCYTQSVTGQNTTGTDGLYKITSTRITKWGGTYAGQGVSQPPSYIATHPVSDVQTVSHVCTVTFANANAAKYYFNAGGVINFSALRDDSIISGTPGNGKNTSWTTLLATMGTITFGFAGVTRDGSAGNGSVFGWNYFANSVPNTTLTLFTNSVGSIGSSLYAPNQYTLKGSLNTAGTVLTFTAEFADLSNAISEDAADSITGLSHNPLFALDQDADGTLIHSVGLVYASGNYVSTTPYLPVLRTTNPLYTDLSSAATVSITTSPGNTQTVTKGQTVSFIISTTGVANGTLTWVNIGTAASTYFADNSNSGTVPLSSGAAAISRTISNNVPSTATLQIQFLGAFNAITSIIAITPT